MERQVFERRVHDLELEILETVEKWFSRRGERFNAAELHDQGSVKVAELAREAHFYGANLMPLSGASDAPATSHRSASS